MKKLKESVKEFCNRDETLTTWDVIESCVIGGAIGIILFVLYSL